MEIGGFFPYQPVDSEPNNYVEHTCPDPGDTAHLMSGRCAILLLSEGSDVNRSKACGISAFL